MGSSEGGRGEKGVLEQIQLQCLPKPGTELIRLTLSAEVGEVFVKLHLSHQLEVHTVQLRK